MKLHWFVQMNMYAARERDRIVDALEECGSNYSMHAVIPFSHEIWPKPNPLYTHAMKAVVLGTFTMNEVARRYSWMPGAYLNDNFNHFEVEAHWPTLNQDALPYRFKDVPEQSDPFFIKPVDDGKVFAGHVTDWPTFQEWRERITRLGHEGTVTPDTEVLVAKPKEIHTETRVWIVDGQVIAGSIYKRGTLVRYENYMPLGMASFCVGLVAKWNPAPAFCIDVATTSQGFCVVELTNLNSAGFYAADIASIVRAIEKMEDRR